MGIFRDRMDRQIESHQGGRLSPQRRRVAGNAFRGRHPEGFAVLGKNIENIAGENTGSLHGVPAPFPKPEKRVAFQDPDTAIPSPPASQIVGIRCVKGLQFRSRPAYDDVALVG
jgi:hypothetical protein